MGRRKKGEKKISFVKKPSRNNASKNLKDRASVKNFQRLLGMKDVLPVDYKFLGPIIKKIEDYAHCYGFNKMDVPVIEGFPLYKKTLDKNRLNNLFILEQKGGEKSCLRPDLIHGMARALVEHNILNTQERPSKFFSIGPVFRQEKVRGGVYKQFTQFNFSIFNDTKPASDAFLIFLVYNIFKELQIDVQVQINSLGDNICQKEFLSKFIKSFKDRGRKNKLCPECKKNLLKNPTLLLECQEESCLSVRNEMPQIINFLSEESNARFYKTLEFLDEMDVNYNFNPYLVKDLGSYNDLIFEIWPIEKNGELNNRISLGRGGRYDNLFNTMTGRDLPFLSFNGGIERMLIKSKENNQLIEENRNDVVFLAQIDSQSKIKAMFLFKDLLKRGFNVFQAFHLDDLKGQMEEAKSYKANIVLILGKKELADETILFRDTDSGVQEIIAQKDLIARLEKNIK
jgi:histidyl-tRNA synthetase